MAGGTTSGLLSGKPLEQSLAGGLTSGAISQVTPSGLLSSGGTSGTTPTQDYVPELNIGQGTTGATNMADITDYFNTGESVSGNYGDPNALQNSFYGYGGFGTEKPTTGVCSTAIRQAEIDAPMQTSGGKSSFGFATQSVITPALGAWGMAA